MNFERPHRRRNALTGEWVLVSPHRAKRPWQGQVEKSVTYNLSPYDPDCYLCPGNPRAGGTVKNPEYTQTFVFDNDFSALLPPDGSNQPWEENELFRVQAEDGICRVICFSPRHDLSLPEISLGNATEVIRTWRTETELLIEKDFIHYVQIFENKGAVMGCSNPHPHSQIWATDHIPTEPQKELDHQEAYFNQHRRTLLGDYLVSEQKTGKRIVVENDHFSAIVPFWAVWPFEILVICKRPAGSLLDLSEAEIVSQADILQQVTTRFDNLFEISFPYSMGFHQKPFDGNMYPGWHLHCHFYPPLLRSATVKKFMVGFEMLAMPQRDITPEAAAQKLRETSKKHYRSEK